MKRIAIILGLSALVMGAATSLVFIIAANKAAAQESVVAPPKHGPCQSPAGAVDCALAWNVLACTGGGETCTGCMAPGLTPTFCQNDPANRYICNETPKGCSKRYENPGICVHAGEAVTVACVVTEEETTTEPCSTVTRCN
jgi:hypothetical protein